MQELVGRARILPSDDKPVPENLARYAVSLLAITKNPSYLRSIRFSFFFREYPHRRRKKSLRVSVQGVLAALTSSALALANWFRTRWIRVRQVAGASRGWCTHGRRRRRKKALQACLTHRKSMSIDFFMYSTLVFNIIVFFLLFNNYEKIVI